MKKYLLIFIAFAVVCTQMSACSNIASSNPDSLIITLASTTDIQKNYDKQAATPSIVIVTPRVTATPIKNVPDTDDGINKLIEKIYPVNPNPNCNVDVLNTNDRNIEKPILKFNTPAIDPVLMNYMVEEIADNSSHTIRAFLACDNPKHCHEHLFLKNLINGNVTEINWSTQNDIRPINNIIWIGDDLLAFAELTGVYIITIAVIEVKEERFNLFLLSDNRCQ
jgi:hypothetical protein